MKSRVTLQDGMAFDAELDGFNFTLDAAESVGGQNKGPKPKGLTLTSLAGCTAMDVISILRKMRAEPDEFYVETEAEVSEEHPMVFTSIKITYYFRGENVTREKAEKAVSLSEERYCGVSAMLRQAAPITTEIIIDNG
jgi:putative redox protein